MKKRITLKEWETIWNLNYAAKWFRPFCDYYLEETDGGNFRRTQYIGLPLFILAFIPVHVIYFFQCMWDGGIKNFSFGSRYLSYDHLEWGSERWKRAKEIYEKGLDK